MSFIGRKCRRISRCPSRHSCLRQPAISLLPTCRLHYSCEEMRHFKMVFQFGWVYLRRYWVRLVLGLVLGVLFGMTNASFVWATKTLMERLDDPTKKKVPSVSASVPAKTPSELKV